MNARWTRMTREHVMWDDRDMKFCEMRPFIFLLTIHYKSARTTSQMMSVTKVTAICDCARSSMGMDINTSGPIFRRV